MSYQFEAGRIYRMPTHFGPAPDRANCLTMSWSTQSAVHDVSPSRRVF